MELERVVKRYYDGLEEGIIWGRRCLECGAIEFPPHYACNTCGYHATEWVQLSGHGWLKTVILPATTTEDNRLSPHHTLHIGLDAVSVKITHSYRSREKQQYQ